MEKEKSDSELWAEYHADRQEKKRENEKRSLELVSKAGFAYTIFKGSAHYKVRDFNFWPSTGKYYNPKTGEKGRGVFNLLRELKK